MTPTEHLEALRAAGADATERPALVLAAGFLERGLDERARAVLDRAAGRFARHQVVTEARAAERERRAAPRREAVLGRLANALELARRRGVRLPAHLRRRSGAADREAVDLLGRHLFHESLHAAKASFAVARALKDLPDEAGHYNPQTLGARVLALFESLSPDYLRTLLASLDDLEALSRLPEVKRSVRKRG